MLHTLLKSHALHCRLENSLCGLVICICVCMIHITNDDTPPSLTSSPLKNNFKNPTQLKHMKPLKDLTHKQYISSLPVKASKPLLRTGNSLTMFITDIQKQLKSTRCWGRTGLSKAPQAEWGQVQDHVSGSSKLQKGNKDSDIPVGPYETGHQRRRWEENHSLPTVKGTRKSKPNGTIV